MTHDPQPQNAPPKRRAAHIALVVASTALISAGVILPASAATPALSHSTASPTVVSNDDDSGMYDPGPWSDPSTGYTNDGVSDGYGDDSIYPDPYEPGEVTDDAGSDGYGDGSFYPGEDTVDDGGGDSY
jgi:hypothetical protein